MGRGSRIRIDRSWASALASTTVLFLVRVILCKEVGSAGAGYLCVPMELLLVMYVIFFLVHCEITRSVMTPRMRQARTADAMRFFELAIIVSALLGALFTAGAAFGSWLIGNYLAGESDLYLIMLAGAPAILFLSVTGVLRGYLYSLEMEPAAQGICYVFAALCLVLSFALSRSYSRYGDKVSALLRVDHYGAIYGAVGLMLGISIASFVCLILLIVLCLIGRNAMRKKYGKPSFFGYDEERGGARKVFLSYALPMDGSVLLIGTVILLDQRLLQLRGRPEEFALKLGGVYGYAIPMLVLILSLCVLPLSRLGYDAAVQYLKENRSGFRARSTVLMRIGFYILIPAALLPGACARSLCGVMMGYEAEGTVHFLQWGVVIMILTATFLLWLQFCYQCQLLREVLLACLGGALAQALFVFLMCRGEDRTVDVIAAGCVIFLIATHLILSIQMRRTLQIFLRSNDLMRLAVNLICGCLSALVVLLLQGPMLEGISYLPAFVIELVVFWILYLLSTMITRCADYKNLTRIPGGVLVLRLAEVLRL